MSIATLEKLELNRVYQMDAIEGMRMIPNESVDLIVIDPPYNIGKDARWDKWKTVEEYVEFMTKVFRECGRVLKPNGSFYWFHNDFLQVVELQNAINEYTSFVFKQFIVWNKRFLGARNKGFLDGFIEVEHLRNYQKMAEYCLFYTFQKDNYGNTTDDIDTNNYPELRKYFKELFDSTGLTKKAILEQVGQRADHCLRYGSSQWGMPTEETYNDLIKLTNEGFHTIPYAELKEKYEESYGEHLYTFNNQKTHHSVWDYDIAPKVDHVTPKPIDLIENIVRHSSNEGDIILDCFLGSGTTAVAAINTNRQFIGIERESEYVDIANQRISEALKEAS